MPTTCPTCGQQRPDDPIARFSVGMRVRFEMGGQERLGAVIRIQGGSREIVVSWDDDTVGIYDAPWFRTGRATIEPIT